MMSMKMSKKNREQILKFVMVSIVILALVLITDQLYLFGIPFGGFLGDLSAVDPTQPYTDFFHHWMVGVVLISAVVIWKQKHKKR